MLVRAMVRQLLALGLLLYMGGGLHAQIKLHLYFTGDIHGVIRSDVPENQGDILRIRKAMAREYRARNLYPGDYLLFDTGDALSYNYLSKLDSGRTVFRNMAEAGFDAMIPGDLDLTYGLQHLRALSVDYPGMKVISSNLGRKNGEPLFPPFVIFQRQGVRIGLVGAVERNLVEQVTGRERNDLAVGAPEVALRQMVDSIRSQVDLVVALNHLDMYQNLDLARQVPGIDIMISKYSGDSINQIMLYDNSNEVRTAIYQAAGNATSVKHIAVDMMLNGSGFRKTAVELLPEVPVDTVSFEGVDLRDHQRLQRAFQEYLQMSNRFLTPDHRVAKLGDNPDSEIMDYALYTMLRSTHSEVAILNRGALIMPENWANRNYLTIRDIERMSRPNDKVVIMRLSGRSLKAILARGRQFDPSSNQYLYAVAIGDYQQTGSRNVKPHNQNLNDNQMYAVVTNEFLAGGGDGYLEFQKGTHQRSAFLGETRLRASLEEGAEPIGLSQLLIRFFLQGINPDLSESDQFYSDDNYLNKSLLLMKFENIDISYKSVRVNNNEDFTNPSDGRVRDNTQNATNIASSGYLGLIRYTARTRWENGVLFRYALQSIGDQEIQESDDRLDLQTILDWDDPFNLFKSSGSINLYSSLRFETEFTANENAEGEAVPRRQDLFFYLGLSRFGKENREIRLAFTTKNNLVTQNQDAGFELNAKYYKKFRWFLHGSLLRGRFLFNQPGRQPGSEKASLDYTAFAQFNIIDFISLKPQINVFVYQDMALKKVATNVQFQVSLSFSRLWKPQYIRFIRRDIP